MTDESTKQDPAMNSIWSIGSDVRPNLKNNRKVKRQITPLGKTGRLYIYIYTRQLPPKDPCQYGLVMSLVESSGFRCSRVAVFQPRARESKRGTMTRFSFDDEPSPEILSLFVVFRRLVGRCGSYPFNPVVVVVENVIRRDESWRLSAVLEPFCHQRLARSSRPRGGGERRAGPRCIGMFRGGGKSLGPFLGGP